LPSSWRRLLNQELKSLVKINQERGRHLLPRIAILGVGNEFNADDIIGPLVSRRLAAAFPDHSHLLIRDTGTAPENFTGSLRTFKPDLVILVDAVDMQMPVGSIAWVLWDDLEGAAAFTHAPTPAMFGDFLRDELDCSIALIGVQPASLVFDQPPSREVLASTRRVSAGVKQSLKSLGY